MSLPATDTLNHADNPTDWGPNWTIQTGVATLVSGSGELGNANSSIFWNADAFAADHYSQVVMTFVTGLNSGCVVRASGTAGARNCYLSYGNSNIYKDIGGSYTLLGSGSAQAVNGDTVKMTATGTTIAVLINGVSKNSLTDSSLASGSAGLFGDSATSRFNTWEGGNIGGGGGTNWGQMMAQRLNRIVQVP